jgi:hypothetical protein
MAGPTELLGEDVKALREDLHKLEVSVRDEIHRVELALSGDIRELSTKVGGILSSIRLLGVMALTGLATAIWALATLSASTKALDTRLVRIETAISKLATVNPKSL